jgi:hypothetical protein
LTPLVPEAEGQRFEAGEKCERFHGLEERFGPMTFFEVIIGNSRAQMVNVMEANVSREPLQDFGQFIKRTTL